MSIETDYGSTLTKGGVAVGKCRIIDFPEIVTQKVDTTNHAGGGVSSKIPSGVYDVGDITCLVLMDVGTLAGIKAEIAAKTVSEVIVTNGLDTITGQAFYTSVKEEAADATSPDAIRASVVIAFSGDVTVTSTP